MIDVISTAAPGIDDIVVLGKIKQLERSRQWDLIVVDGPAAGHAITFLTSAKGMLDSVRGGPVYAQAKDVMELLGDPERCQVVLVTLPETTPVNEVIETTAIARRSGRCPARAGRDQRGRHANGRARSDDDEARPRAPTPTRCARRRVFRRARRAMQDDEIARLVQSITTPVIELVSLPVAGLTADDIRMLAASLANAEGTA